MNLATFPIGFFLALAAHAVAFAGPKPLDMDAATAEVSSSYGKASPEVREFVLHTCAHLRSQRLVAQRKCVFRFEV